MFTTLKSLENQSSIISGILEFVFSLEILYILTFPLREKCPNTEFFLVRYFLNSDQKNLCIWTFFTQCSFVCYLKTQWVLNVLKQWFWFYYILLRRFWISNDTFSNFLLRSLILICFGNVSKIFPFPCPPLIKITMLIRFSEISQLPQTIRNPPRLFDTQE